MAVNIYGNGLKCYILKLNKEECRNNMENEERRVDKKNVCREFKKLAKSQGHRYSEAMRKVNLNVLSPQLKTEA